MRTFRNLAVIGLIIGSFVFSSHATFSSIYIFGDSISTTTTNVGASYSPNTYYGQRYSNGRTWVEVLAERQGLGANSRTNPIWAYSSNNVSFYGQYSPVLLSNVNKFTNSPTNSLFVVWVCNADFVGDIAANAPNDKSNGTNLTQWTNAINLHIINHSNAIVSLGSKGCRTLIAPNAVDLTKIPQYNTYPAYYKAFVRQQIISFNDKYATMLNQIQASNNFSGLKICNPDIFSLLNNVLANAASYGLTDARYDYGYGAGLQSIDVSDAAYLGLLANANTNGPGTNYIFLDPISPTAAMSEVIADFCQQYISPVRISALKQINGSNVLTVANMPVDLNGYLDNSTNLATANWTLVTNFSSPTTTNFISVSTPPLPDGFGSGGSSGSGGGSSGPPNPGDTNTVASGTNSTPFLNTASQFYRLRFPYAWNWP